MDAAATVLLLDDDDNLRSRAGGGSRNQGFVTRHARGRAARVWQHCHGHGSGPGGPATTWRSRWTSTSTVFCQGNITVTARALDIHRRSLQRKLAKFPVAR
jgi:transcriptional regulator of acetoin/glycerol metabolism